MTKPIVQSILFSATAKELYDIYLEPAKHKAVTGGKAIISAKPSSKFSAFDGMLAAVPGKLIIQCWRATHWPKTDEDSILILSFTSVGRKGRIDLVHINVPVHDHAGVTKGWSTYYWRPLKAYLKKRRK